MLVTIPLRKAVGLSGALLLAAMLPDARAGLPSSTPERYRQSDIAVREGDILIRPDDNRRGLGTGRAALTWPDGIVPYQIAAGQSDESIARIEDAVQQWNEETGISLVPLERFGIAIPTDYLVFRPGGGCASWIGRQGGAQDIWISDQCTRGSIVHEIGHALGLEHEHTRPDRDQYLQINWDNIEPDRVHNFAIVDRPSRLLGEYDYASIMHYGEYFFSRNGVATLQATRDTDAILGQRFVLSDGDVAAIETLYATDLALNVGLLETLDAGRDANNDTLRVVRVTVTNLQQQGAHDVSLQLPIEHIVETGSMDDWRCEPGTQVTHCQLERLSGNNQSIIDIVFTGAQVLDNVEVSITAKTPDNNAINDAAPIDANQPLLASRELPSADDAGGTGPFIALLPWMLLLLTARTASGYTARQRVSRTKRCKVQVVPPGVNGRS